MRWSLRISVLFGTLLAAMTSFAADSKPQSQLPNLATKLQSVRFFVADGRLQALAGEAGVERESSSDLGTSRREKLVLNTNDRQDASIHYELSTGGEMLTVDIVEGEQFTITRHQSKGSPGPNVEFRQPKEGPLSLSISDRETVREIKGATLWHLLLSEPELCRHYLLPLLEMFRSQWRLAETAQAIETRMLHTAAEYRPENLKTWDALVADLASDRYADRHRADRELRAIGPVVIPYLQGLDHRHLDFEQWSHIQDIVAATDSDDEDGPDSAANQLMSDRGVWLDFLDRPLEASRRIAAQQLSYLWGQPIQFDPAASEQVRHRQLEPLRQKVERESAAEAKSAE